MEYFLVALFAFFAGFAFFGMLEGYESETSKHLKWAMSELDGEIKATNLWYERYQEAISRAESAESNYEDVQQKLDMLEEHFQEYRVAREAELKRADLYRRVAKRLIWKRRACLQWLRQLKDDIRHAEMRCKTR